MSKVLLFAVILLTLLTTVGFIVKGNTHKPVIVCFGDSLTEGYPAHRNDADDSGDEQSQYSYWLKASLGDVDTLNYGRASDTTGRMVTRYQRDVIAVKPDVVIILAGANDFDPVPLSTTFRNITMFVEQAKRAHIVPVLCTVPPRNRLTGRVKRIEQLNNMIIGYANNHDVAVVDLYKPLLSPSDKHRLNLAYDADGLHMNVHGYHLIADAILPVVEKALSR